MSDMTRQERSYEVREYEDDDGAYGEIVQRGVTLMYIAFAALNGMLGLRFILKLLGANPEAPFAALLYDVTNVFLWPFQGLFQTPQAGEVVIEVSTLIAMVVYALAAWLIGQLIWTIFKPAD